MNVQAATPVRPAQPVGRAAAPAAQPLGRASGDSLALSAAARATGGQVVVIDGREFEVKARRREWNAVDKAVTWTATGIGALAAFALGAPMLPYLGGTVAALVGLGVLLGAGGTVGYGIGRAASSFLNWSYGKAAAAFK